MPTSKIHVIEAYPTGLDPVTERDRLGRAIAGLAKTLKEPVWFHDFKKPSAGAPVVMVECSDTLMDYIRDLPDFGGHRDLWEVIATERSPKLQAYFTTEKAAQPCSAFYRPKSSGPKF